MAEACGDSSAAQDREPWPVWAEAAREAAGLSGAIAALANAACRPQRQRLVVAAVFASGDDLSSSSAAVFDVPLRCRMFYMHASGQERHCFDGVCSGVRLGRSSFIGLSRKAVPHGIWGG